MLLLALFACGNPTYKGDTDTDTGYASVDTAPIIDTADDTSTTATDDSATDTQHETGDSGDTDTGPTGPTALDVYPASLVVNPGATLRLRVVATEADGTRGDVTAETFASDDDTIATVDADGNVTALAAGTVTLRVGYGGLEGDVTLDVRDDLVATVTVIDAETGAPIPDARVALPFTDSIRTDASGVALLPVTDGGPLTFTAWVDDTWNATTVTGVVGRTITVPIWPRMHDRRDAQVHGTVDYTNVDDAGFGELVAGFAGTSIQGALAATKLEDLFAENRTVSVFGVDADIPSNLFLEGTVDDFTAQALAGPVAAWGIAGPMPIDEATASLNGSGEAMALLVDHLDDMSWGVTTGLTASYDAAAETTLAPAGRFDDDLVLDLPALPTGFNGTEQLFVVVADERAGEGYVPTGLGIGSGTCAVQRVVDGSVPDSLGTSVLAFAQVGGIGSGGATSTSVGHEGPDGEIVFAELQPVPTVDAYDAASRALTATVDPAADFVRIRLEDPHERIHDVLAPASWSGTLPRAVTDFMMNRATIEVTAVSTEDGAYESWLAAGVVEPDQMTALSVARTVWEN
jgi:hypothetical protein